jgi:hypothetical protein
MTPRRQRKFVYPHATSDVTDLPPPYDPTFPHAIGRNAYIDVDGRAVIFEGDDPTGDRDLYLAVAQSTLLNFRRIFDAMTAILYPHCPPDGPFEPPDIKRLLADKTAEAQSDAALLKLPLPVEEAFEIWKRSCDGLRLCAELDPDPVKRQELLDAVAASERRMAQRCEQHIQKYEARKNGSAQA